MMMAGALFLMTGCSTDDAAETTLIGDASAAAQAMNAITFTCVQQTYPDEAVGQQGYSDGALTRASYGHEGLMDNAELYTTGFGVFASTEKGVTPDIMYNQEVKYTLVGDLVEPKKGYWSYEPIKYWPNSPTGITAFDICAYAPYVEPPGVLADGTKGIIGLSGNDETTRYVDFRRATRADEIVDLLWWHNNPYAVIQPTLAVSMRHALARIAINIKVKAEDAGVLIPDGTRLLVKSITLSSTKEAPAEQTGIADKGRLILNEHNGTGDNICPVWEEQVLQTATILFDSNERNANCYGYVDVGVRYIDGLPYDWQPEGLTTTAKNALCTVDRQAYIYLIPQDELTMSCEVVLQKMTNEGVSEEVTKVNTITITPLKGNKPYTLDLTINKGV